MAAAFHFAFFVRDLASTRRFYGEVLGCREGRSTDTWIDFDFFGNQISAHAAGVTERLGNTTGGATSTSDRTAAPPAHATGTVDGVAVPMPHFGAIVSWEEFGALAERIRAAGVSFVIEPCVRYEGQPGEQATMFLHDPSGNALEFKSFKHPEHVFTT